MISMYLLIWSCLLLAATYLGAKALANAKRFTRCAHVARNYSRRANVIGQVIPLFQLFSALAHNDSHFLIKLAKLERRGAKTFLCYACVAAGFVILQMVIAVLRFVMS